MLHKLVSARLLVGYIQHESEEAWLPVLSPAFLGNLVIAADCKCHICGFVSTNFSVKLQWWQGSYLQSAVKYLNQLQRLYSVAYMMTAIVFHVFSFTLLLHSLFLFYAFDWFEPNCLLGTIEIFSSIQEQVTHSYARSQKCELQKKSLLRRLISF